MLSCQPKFDGLEWKTVVCVCVCVCVLVCLFVCLFVWRSKEGRVEMTEEKDGRNNNESNKHKENEE